MRTVNFFAFFLIFFYESQKKKKPDEDSIGLFCKISFLSASRIKSGIGAKHVNDGANLFGEARYFARGRFYASGPCDRRAQSMAALPQSGFGRRFIAAGNRLINAANKVRILTFGHDYAPCAVRFCAPFSSMNSNWPCSNLITMLRSKGHMWRVIGAARPPVNLNVTPKRCFTCRKTSVGAFQ